jgi:multidrug resistance efflux pump
MQAEASEAKNRVLLEELTVRAPIDGVVLQKNMNAGEYLQVSDHLTPPLILGNKTLLQVKADIDEQNASYMTEGAAAVACPKNRPDFHIPLKFVRVEPYVIPKRSLTGSSREKVDTRVLQVVYTFEPPQDISLYVGQQVDVFIQKSQDNLIAETP